MILILVILPLLLDKRGQKGEGELLLGRLFVLSLITLQVTDFNGERSADSIFIYHNFIDKYSNLPEVLKLNNYNDVSRKENRLHFQSEENV